MYELARSPPPKMLMETVDVRVYQYRISKIKMNTTTRFLDYLISQSLS